ncbi:peroxin [Coemansia spiralis]|uniref:Peroxin n=2 Tax=Coemansia TaxID=4863 RepID=A0A9W8L0Y6_9FUNG|nr:Peroxin-3 [Coemansia spiralis]KAJ1994094.1 peroxin [Coemansia umbellata]KAJ2623606.1 peroxin [Coemansia sp. RSA 1358]KAJ2680276.1 peroxin [Coemansia spiralis]
MLDGAWNFVRRHQRKLIIGTSVVGGLYISAKVLTQKLIEMQATSAKERASKENIRRRFDQNQRDCLFTIMSLLPELSEQILREVDVERFIAELRAIHKPQTPRPKPEVEAAGGAHEEGNVGNVWSSNKEAEMQNNSGSEKQDSSNGNSNEPSDATQNPEQLQENDEDTINVKHAANSQDVAAPPKRSKVEIWEDIKLQSFARALIAVYSESLLTMLVHIQLNMVGRNTYLDTVVGKLTDTNEGRIVLEGQYEFRLSAADEQNFLMLSWWFLNRGWRHLMALIVDAVNYCVGPLALKARVSHRELISLLNSIHVRLRESGLIQALPGFILPLGDANVNDYLASNRLSAEQVFTPVFVRLLDQIRDVVESNDFSYVLNSCIDRLTSQLLEALQESFPEPVPMPAPSKPLPPTVEGETVPNLDEVVKEFEEFSAPPESRVVVVQLLPRIAREGHQILNGVPNHYLENVSASREVQALSAAVYTAEPTAP